MGVSETVLAAMIGAGATLLTAFFQLMSALRASGGERRSARTSFRSLVWMLAMLLAAGVGGFAYSEYRSQRSGDETRALRDEMQAQMRAIAASAARLEHLRFASAGPASDVAPGTAGAPSSVAATVALPACRGHIVGFATERGPCAEQDAVKIAVCAPVPAQARVTAVDLFSRLEDSEQPWEQARMTLGHETAFGRFVDAHYERPDTDATRLVCQTFAHWNSAKGRSVRILVRYGA